MSRSTDDARRLAELEAAARWSRERRDLYRAKSYGPRPTTPARMRELEQESTQAEERLRAFKAEQRRLAGD